MKSLQEVIPRVRLKQERLSRGWSQADVAEKIGSDTKTVGRWERGVTFPSPYLCQQLCTLYEKTVQELALVKEEDTPLSDTTLGVENDKELSLLASPQVISQQERQREGDGTKGWRPSKRLLVLFSILFVFTLLIGGVLSTSLPPLKESSAHKATLPPANPYADQGRLALDNALGANTAAGWSLSNNDEGQCFFANGAYRIRGIKSEYMKLCVAAETYFTNFVYEVQMQVVAGDCGGVAFRTTFPQLYYFLICQDGKYRFVRYDRDSHQNRLIVASGISSTVQPMLDRVNVLGVVANGNTFALYVNHTLLYQGTDGAYLDGRIGLLVHTCRIVYSDMRHNVCDVPVEVAFRNARVWNM